MRLGYRDAGPKDAASVDRIFKTTFSETFGQLYRPEDLKAFLSSFALGDWQAQLSDAAYAFRIAEADGEPAGYVKLGPMKLPIDTNRPAVLLDQFYVLQAHHGAGIAQTLMDWALEEARRRAAEELYLTVFIDNHRARRFYERYAFEPVGSYAFMVGSHADEDVIMRKAL